MLTTEDKLIKIRCDKEWDEKWSDKLNKIKAGMNKFEIAKSQNLDEPEQHLNQILPTYWEVFHTHNTYEKEKGSLSDLDFNYDIGIFLVGFSSLPIVLSLAEIRPTKEVYFLYSKETENMLSEISNRISVMRPGSTLSCLAARSVNDSNYALEIQSSSDPVQTFKRIKEVIDKVGDKRIALDLTGGKKTMLGGGFTAGSILGLANSIRSSDCDMFYVDSLDYDALKRAPIYGTEFLSQLKNPYDIYNVQSVQQAEKLFENHNYEAAAILLEDVDKNLNEYAKSYNLEKEQDVVQKNLYMADCYGLWDAFDYIAAKNSKQNNGTLWDYNNRHTYNPATTNIDVLEILSAVENLQTLFAEEARIIHYAVDRYQNGIRRKKSDRYEDAIVRFTQTVEILCKFELYRIVQNRGLLFFNKNAASGTMRWQTLNAISRWDTWKLTPLIMFLFGDTDDKYESYPYSYKISNSSNHLSPTIYGYNEARNIADLIMPRNEFIHVENSPTWSEMENLRNLARTFLKNFYGKYYPEEGLIFDDLLELHRFHRIRE